MNSDYCLINVENITSIENCVTTVDLPVIPPPAGAACWTAGWGVYDYDEDSLPCGLKTVGINLFSKEYILLKVKLKLSGQII